MIIHPAFSIPFADLIEGLELECNLGNVNKRHSGSLTQYTYTQQATFNAAWNLFTTVARGIIVDQERIVAAPFPKFFNLTENKTVIPDLPFKCYEKVDGSLIIVFYYNGEWRTATKGSFNSDQSIAAKKYIDASINLDYWIRKECPPTFLFEYVGPSNKIVVSYPKEDMILLGGYDSDGMELTREELNCYSIFLKVSLTKDYDFSDLDAISAIIETLSSSEEGFVIRYEDGTRVKIKGAEYCRIHRLISHITPLAIWEMMFKGDDLEFIRKELPEEFLADFDEIHRIINSKVLNAIKKVRKYCMQTIDLTDKDIGLVLHSLEDEIRALIFPCRKNGDLLSNPKSRQTLFRMYRPTANRLEGYVPSSSMNRVQEDE